MLFLYRYRYVLMQWTFYIPAVLATNCPGLCLVILIFQQHLLLTFHDTIVYFFGEIFIIKTIIILNRQLLTWGPLQGCGHSFQSFCAQCCSGNLNTKSVITGLQLLFIFFVWKCLVGSCEWCLASVFWNPLKGCVVNSLNAYLKAYCLQCFDAVGWAAGRASSL